MQGSAKHLGKKQKKGQEFSLIKFKHAQPAGDHGQQPAVINKQMTCAHKRLLSASDAQRLDPAEGRQGPCLAAG